ncbi:MAG TPA: hypothetical protein PLU83_15010, partial [Phycicoccus sp.]|nr:hypothetical protein [Phycicoccus sp.]
MVTDSAACVPYRTCCRRTRTGDHVVRVGIERRRLTVNRRAGCFSGERDEQQRLDKCAPERRGTGRPHEH